MATKSRSSARRSPVLSGQVKDTAGIIDTQVEVIDQLATDQASDNETRQEVAKKFVRYYFWIMIGIIIAVPVYNIVVYLITKNTDLTLSLKDTILTYSAVVGPTVGLVVAYYFKTKND